MDNEKGNRQFNCQRSGEEAREQAQDDAHRSNRLKEHRGVSKCQTRFQPIL
jgi:hypothetical protein